ncbi:transcription termination factor MTEF18, mitochondrial-like [Wolffia australiana]
MLAACSCAAPPSRRASPSSAKKIANSPSQIRPLQARIPRLAIADAQRALCEYLHLTRGLHFADAEHLSKNSPAFLRRLIARLQLAEHAEIGKSLAKYLRYHPINEFEPFLESLGLKHSEIPSLLPRRLFFLSDDSALLRNFNVLCSYGLPRGKIGKIYKEAKEIFEYPHGVLSSKLAAYEALGLGIPTVIKLVGCSPSLLIGGVDRDFLRVLGRLQAAGTSHDWIRRCLPEENSYDWSRMLELLQFLDQLGFEEDDLGRLIRDHPRFLFEDSGKKIDALVAMLLKLGGGIDGVVRLLTLNPRILDGPGVKNIHQSMNFLLAIGLESERVAQILCALPQVLGSSPLKKPEFVLSTMEIERAELCAMIAQDPYRLSGLVEPNQSPTKKPGGNHLHEKTVFLLKLGFVENSDEMVSAMRKFRGRGDQLQERFDCLVAAGLDCHAVAAIVKEAPPMLNQRTAVLRQKIEYLVNDLGYPVESLLSFPTYLCYSPRRIKLRFAMHGWLKQRGKGKEMVSLSTILAGSNARFVNYFVNRHPDGPEQWERLSQREEKMGTPGRVAPASTMKSLPVT